jgi:hypothetical protein
MGRRRIKVRGVRRAELDTNQLALALWLMAKRAAEEKRDRRAGLRRIRREVDDAR